MLEYSEDDSFGRINEKQEKRLTQPRTNSSALSQGSTEVPHSRENSYNSANRKLENELRMPSGHNREDSLMTSNSVVINKPSELMKKSQPEMSRRSGDYTKYISTASNQQSKSNIVVDNRRASDYST